MANAVKVYKSTDQNAPVLTGEVGKLVDLLTACLVDGYTAASVSGITRSGTIATVTLASANSTLRTGDWVTIAGANESDYNGEFQITVSDSTHFTYQVANSPATPATGTITYKKSGAGWTKPFTGTNKAAFRGGATNNTAQFYLRVNDSGGSVGGALEAVVRAYESMSDVDIGTAVFPSLTDLPNSLCWRKSATANSTAREWCIVADDRGFYIQINAGGSAATTSTNYFGWFPSYKSSDAYNCVVTGNNTFNTASGTDGLAATGTFTNMSTNSATSIARGYSQLGSGILARSVQVVGGTTIGGANNILVNFPNPQDSALWVSPLFIGEASNSIRGRFPGAYHHLHSTIPFSNYDEATGIVGLPGITCMALNAKSSSTAGQFLVDITGPWS